MIYDVVDTGAPIRQGDIFEELPRVEISLSELSVINDHQEAEAVTWDAIRQNRGPVTALLPIKSVWAIVITQDCDTIRAPDISLCEIRPLSSVIKLDNPTTPGKWANLIRRQAIANQKWFYMPPDPEIGFRDRRAVDFLASIRVAREDLENSRHLRRGRLNATADEHFRERLAEFFRRYPYNEWYPFNKDEFEAYRAANPGEAELIVPYPYQR